MDDSTVFDALAPDSQSGSEGFQGIDILPFLFPVQVEPEYESFRVNFCDRLLGELYTAQRQRRIQEIRRNIARSLDLAAGSETLSLSNGTADDDDVIETKPGRPSTKEESSAFLPKSKDDALKESEGLPPLQTSFLCDTPLSIFCSPSPTVCKLSPASMTCSWALSSEARDATTRAITTVGRSSPPMSTRIGRSTLLSSTFHLSCLTENENGTAPPTAGLSTEDKKPISIDTTMEETTDDYDALSLVESSRNPLDEDDHSTADIYPTPAVRYGRNSGMRRLEDLKRRLQDDAFQHHRSTLLEEEVRWELRLPMCYRLRRWCGGSRVVDDGVSPTAPLSTMSTDSFRESKWFHFGNRWWVMHFGITASSAASAASAAPGAAGAAGAAVASDVDGKTEDVFCYLHVCPAERLLEPAYVAMECWLFPSSSLSASSSSSVPSGHHRREFPSDVCFGCVDSGEEGIPPQQQQQHGGGKGPTGAVQGWDRFIATDQLPLYVNDDGKIQLTLIMRSRLGAHGQLLGSK